MSTPQTLTAEQKRALHPDFISTFSLAALRSRLSLRFPIPAGTPPLHLFPGDPPQRGVTTSHDLMPHEARSRMRCPFVTEICYHE